MRYFICLLSSLIKLFIVVVPLCLLVASCLSKKKEQPDTFHPCWHLLNKPEDNLNKDQCIFTKFGVKGLRFYVTPRQQPFNAKDACSKSKENIVQTDPEQVNWVVTPHFYGSVTKEKFPKTRTNDGMKYKVYDPKKGGIPLVFLEELLAVDPIVSKNAIVILSTGIDGKLGVSEALKKALEDKKAKGAIQDYRMLRSGQAVREHNHYVKEGKKVFTFIHAAG